MTVIFPLDPFLIAARLDVKGSPRVWAHGSVSGKLTDPDPLTKLSGTRGGGAERITDGDRPHIGHVIGLFLFFLSCLTNCHSTFDN